MPIQFLYLYVSAKSHIVIKLAEVKSAYTIKYLFLHSEMLMYTHITEQ